MKCLDSVIKVPVPIESMRLVYSSAFTISKYTSPMDGMEYSGKYVTPWFFDRGPVGIFCLVSEVLRDHGGDLCSMAG